MILVNLHGLSRKHIFASVKASLARMDLEYVDVLQCHRFDYDTPIEETMDALHDVVKQGLAHYIGMSSCHGMLSLVIQPSCSQTFSFCVAYQFHAMQAYAKSKGQTQFSEPGSVWFGHKTPSSSCCFPVSMQPFYNSIYRCV